MRLALLSNVTVDVLARMLGDAHSVWLAPGFGAWMETALAVPDELTAFDPEAVILLLDSSHAPVAAADIETAVSALERALPQATVIVPDLDDLADETGAFFDERMWQLAAMPWSLKGLKAICGEIGRLTDVRTRVRRKVLALDLDNTLWEGVIGEDGVAGIRPRTDFQRDLRALRERGVLLVALSKNNVSDVEPVWDDPRMALRREDFVDLRIDWNDKAANLAACARMLNLGTEAFVFVDDDPVERAQMAARCPDVSVAEWPISVRRLERLCFPRMRLTDEDRRRSDLYRAEAARRQSAAGLTLDDYLKQLEIRTEIHLARADEFARIAQLSQKTNQFNVCTNRLTMDDIARFAADPSHLLVTLHASDRFGDQGLVAFARLAPVPSDATSTSIPTYEILDFAMSCRAMNRRIEFALEDWIESELRRRGVAKLRSVWKRTDRNAPVRDLFEKFGFTLLASSDSSKAYERALV